MTISSSLNTSVAGLAANASRLATISDNIANSSTYGYKRAVTDFHAMVIDSGTGSYSAGGVRTTSSRLIDQSGSLVSTTSATDLAVRGRGMLPVTTQASVNVSGGETPLLLTTTGSFETDSNGYLTTSSGLVLLGWPANSDGSIGTYARDTTDGLVPIKVSSTQFSAEPTTEIQLSVNLPASSTESSSDGTTETLSIEYYDNLGKSESLNVEFQPSVPSSGSSNEWTMILRDSASGDTIVGEYILTFDDTRGAGGTLLSVTNTAGSAYDATTGTVTVDVAGGPIEIDIGMLGASDGMTQLSTSFQPVEVSKNGSTSGNLTSVEIDENGYVSAAFDTGVTKILYQVPLVDVANTNGLETLDYQAYRPTSESGAFYLWDAGDGPTGDIVSYAQEESSTDVAGELTDLIQTQRAYSSNAKVIQAVDEMLQETTNIKR